MAFKPLDEAISLFKTSKDECLKLELLKLIISYEHPQVEKIDQKALAQEMLDILRSK
jgi:hypothetical protein